MYLKFKTWGSWTSILLLLLTTKLNAVQQNNLPSFKVMSFNVLCSMCYKSAYDSWEDRLPHLENIVNRHQPDILGTQELMWQSEVQHFLKKWPHFEAVFYNKKSRTNEDGTIFYNKNRFELIGQGQFWLSATPEVYSRGWYRLSVPRFLNWIVLKDKLAQKPFLVINNHFDINKPNPEKSALLVLKRFAEFPADLPIVYTGDFNSKRSDTAYQILTTPNNNNATNLYFENTYDLSPKAFVEWNVENDQAVRVSLKELPLPASHKMTNIIDHILIKPTPLWQVDNWVVDHWTYGPKNRPPSDHKVISVEINWNQLD